MIDVGNGPVTANPAGGIGARESCIERINGDVVASVAGTARTASTTDAGYVVAITDTATMYSPGGAPSA